MEVELTINESHLREHYEEWVATLGPNTRWKRRISNLLILVGALSWATHLLSEGGGQSVNGFGTVAVLSGCFMRFELTRSRAAWMRVAMARRGFGSTHLLFLNDGVLMVDLAGSNDKDDVELAEIRTTPRGYFLRFTGDKSSIYLPHRRIEPATTREAFLAAISA